MLPAPPVLKTTIIQLNKELDLDENNHEILTNDYLHKLAPGDAAASPSGASGKAVMQRKKRRRSSANVDEEELAKRKHETKQLHSIIEKKRRIKINREFEALKYLIPACRTTSGSTSNSPTIKPVNSSSNNGNKIDGMYKLTILKSSVEYILYLHHIIRQQHELLQQADLAYDYDVNFAKIPLDVNQYRDIDKDFSFKKLVNDFENGSKFDINTIQEHHEEHRDDQEEEDEDDNENDSDQSLVQLPSPDITPDMAPVITMLSKYNQQRQDAAKLLNVAAIRKNSVPISPFTVPMKSAGSTPVMKKHKTDSSIQTSFTLPDPMVNPLTELPRKLRFKLKPINDKVVILNETVESMMPTPAPSVSNDSLNDGDEEHRKLSDHDASTTLLALRRSNIDSLLN